MILEIVFLLFTIALYIALTSGCLLAFEMITEGLDFKDKTITFGGICLLILMLSCGVMLTGGLLRCF